MKRQHLKAKAALKNSQEEMKRYANRNMKEVIEYKKRDKMMLSTEDLM